MSPAIPHFLVLGRTQVNPNFKPPSRTMYRKSKFVWFRTSIFFGDRTLNFIKLRFGIRINTGRPNIAQNQKKKKIPKLSKPWKFAQKLNFNLKPVQKSPNIEQSSKNGKVYCTIFSLSKFQNKWISIFLNFRISPKIWNHQKSPNFEHRSTQH